jgi:hypothetical protein
MNNSLIIGRLTRWAHWKMESGLKLGFKNKISYMRMVNDYNAGPDCGYDMECQQTNEAFKQLPTIPQEVIRMEFLSTAKNEVAKASRLGISVRTYRNYKNNAYVILGKILGNALTYGAVKRYKRVML